MSDVSSQMSDGCGFGFVSSFGIGVSWNGFVNGTWTVAWNVSGFVSVNGIETVIGSVIVISVCTSFSVHDEPVGNVIVSGIASLTCAVHDHHLCHVVIWIVTAFVSHSFEPLASMLIAKEPVQVPALVPVVEPMQ